jgi:signal transduction histidine kinase
VVIVVESAGSIRLDLKMKRGPAMQSDKKLLLLYPVVGVMIFMLLSYGHEGFIWDRSIDTYYLPMTVGFTVGSVIAFMRNTIETRTRKYERQLSQEREDAALGRAAAAIAHEVRNPLNAIAMGLQRLQMEAQDLGSEHRQLLSLMLDSVHRANGIIGDLLRYSRPQRPRKEPFSLGQVVEDMLVLYKPLCSALGIVVRESILFRDPVLGDAGLLKQVVENLLRNAIEAQPAGGSLEMELKGEDKEVVLAVCNGGFRLPQDEATRIFEPYFTTKAQGTGLGMSIAQRIVKAHGGHMDVETNGGDHVTISVRLPLTENPSASRDERKGEDPDENSRRG